MTWLPKILVPIVYLPIVSSVIVVNGHNGIPLVGHEGGITDIDFSVDGKLLLTGSRDSTARVWSLHKKKEIARLPHDGQVSLVRFIGNDKALAVLKTERSVAQTAGGNVYRRIGGEASQLCVWNVDQKQLLYKIDSPASNGDGWITDCAVSPGGQKFAVRMFVRGRTGAAEVVLFDVSTGDALLHRAFRSRIWPFLWQPGPAQKLLHFADSGTKLLSVESNRDQEHIVALDCESGSELYNVASGGGVGLLAATRSAVAATVYQKTGRKEKRVFVRAWDASTGHSMASTNPMLGTVAPIAGSSNDSLLFTVQRLPPLPWPGFSGVAVLDVSTNQMTTLAASSRRADEKITEPEPTGPAAIDPAGRRVVFALSNGEKVQLRVFDLGNSASTALDFTMLQFARCSHLRFSPDGHFLVASCNETSMPDDPSWKPWPTKLLTVWDLTSESGTYAQSTPSPNSKP